MTKVSGVVVGLVVLGMWVSCGTAMPTPAEDVEMENMLLQFDEDALMDTSVVMRTPVPCAFCNQTITLLLEFCKATKARSTDHAEDFLTKCMEIGGRAPGQLETMAAECSETEQEQRRVNRLYERRLRCTKIFRGLVKMYDPYDPCVQIRKDFQQNPMAVCRSGNIDCDTPIDAPRKVDDLGMVPPYSLDPKVAFQPPPKSCYHYVGKIIEACKQQKANDFYLRSNLDGWCNQTFNGTYQVLGCQKVVNGSIQRDKRMDLCSGLKIFPLESHEHRSFCDEYLKISAYKPVALKEYDEYLNKIRGIGKMPAYRWMLNTTTEVTREPMMLP